MTNPFAQMEARARSEFKRRAQRLAARKEPTRVIISFGLALEMLFDEGVAEMVALSFAAAMGETSEERQCFGCLAPWSSTRSVIGVVLVEFLDGSNEALLAGLCRDCTEQIDKILAAVKRDFGDDFSIIHNSSGTA